MSSQVRKFIIYGCDTASMRVKDICELGGDSIVGFLDFDQPLIDRFDGVKVFHMDKILEMYAAGSIDGVLLPREQDYIKRNYWGRLVSNGIKIDDLYLSRWLREANNVNFVQRLVETRYLPYLEIHLADHCNLNCAYCEHYSSLVNEPQFHDMAEIEHGLILLKKYIDDIGMIRLLGGEPLLNKEVGEIVRMVRNMYPHSRLKVVTNGVLLFDMPDKFFDTLRDTDTGIDLSLYPELHKSYEEVMVFFKHKGIERRSMCSQVVSFFNKKQILNPHNNQEWTFRHCYQATCHNLYKDKLGACFLPFVTKYFNKKFNTNIPEDESLDLNNKDLTTEKIRRFLLMPMERCKWCEIPCDAVRWRRVKYPSTLEDWIKKSIL